jgi:hypothetical protein
MPQKFLPAVFAIQCNQQLITPLRPTGCCVLLPRLLASIDALVQVVDSYYECYCQVFGQQRRSKKEKLERAADQRYANNHNLVNASLLSSSDPFRTSSANVDS